jgi:predicted O-methyltransferase YrrM
MTTAFDTVLARYHSRMAAEQTTFELDPAGAMNRRDEFLLAVGEEVGRLLQSLAIGRKAKRILELGTSYGYSTMFLAAAAHATGGKVHTLELVPSKQKFAQSQLHEAGLDACVEWHVGDATSLLEDIPGPFDFVLVDLWKDLYVSCFELFYPKLADNAVVVADNMLFPEVARPDAQAYRAAVRAKRALQSVLLPIGNGIEVSCVWRAEQV